MSGNVDFGRFLHGGDYNPEQWLDRPDILEKDLEYFKKAHINEATLGVFSWAKLEPEEGRFEFEWLEKLIGRLFDNGIRVILATPTGARPRWMAEKYPEVLRVDDRRRRQLFGVRHNHCFSSPVYREKAGIINTELARRLGGHPGVIAWHISNEYNGECHCPLCQDAFRDWLRERYGTVGELNRAWATTFWSHIYRDFSEVESPSPIGESSLMGLNLDWKRFVTDRTVDFMRSEIRAIRDAGSDKPVTTNLMGDYPGLNYHKFAGELDIVSWDSYPLWHEKEERITAMECGMRHDIMRGIQKKPFLLMESSPSATNWQAVSKLRKPGMHHAASMQAVAHGADSVQYFQLRQSRGSYEKFHGAVIDHYGGDDTRVFREAAKVGEDLESIAEIRGSEIPARAAVIFDWENRWALEGSQGPRNQGLYYKEAVEKSYGAFRRLGLNVDLIDMEQALEDYAVVAAPMAYMFRGGFAERVRRFVENGGILISTYWSGIVDETDLCFLGGTPHGLTDVLGLRSTEIDGLFDWESNAAIPERTNSLGITDSYRCGTLCDLVKVSTAEALMVYGEDFYAGMPALTRNAFGRGEAYYVCADFEEGFYDDVYRRIARKAGLEGPIPGIPAGVEVTTREKNGTEYIFVQNFNRNPVEIELPDDCEIMLGEYGGTLGSFDTVILKRETAAPPRSAAAK